jgi:hypothetical protein
MPKIQLYSTVVSGLRHHKPDGHPGRKSWLQYGCCGRKCIACIIQQISCKLWCHVCGQARIYQEPSYEPGCNARTTGKHPAVLLGRQPTAPIQCLCPMQQQCSSTGHLNQHNSGGCFSSGNGGGGIPQQPNVFGSNGAGAQPSTCPPTPYKYYENWNYCHTHGGNFDNAHTSTTCGNPGPMHNPDASCANIMGGSIAGMHNTILPSASGRTPLLSCRPQQQQLQQHYLAAHNPSCTVRRNAIGWWHLPPAYYHGHASLSAQPCHGYGACVGGPKNRKKVTFLQVLFVVTKLQLKAYLNKVLLNVYQSIKQLDAILTLPTKYSVKLHNCF